MDANQDKLVIRADYKALTGMIIYGMVVTTIFIVLTFYTLFPIDKIILTPKGSSHGKVFTGTPAIILSICFSTMFLMVTIFSVRWLRRDWVLRKELPVLYTFTQTGLTLRDADLLYKWEDFRKISNGSAGIYLRLKNEKRKAVLLKPSYMSGEAYRSMMLHIIKYAPKDLTAKLIVPKLREPFSFI